MKQYIVCYDISDNKIRNRVAALLSRYGHRIQHSVFELRCNRQILNTLLSQLNDCSCNPVDIRFYRITRQTLEQSFSLDGQPLQISRPVLVVI